MTSITSIKNIPTPLALLFSPTGSVIVLGEGHTYVDCESSYIDSSELVNVVIADTVTEIHVGAFKNCKNLVSVVFPKSLTKIWDKAFLNCDALGSITIPNSVTYIGEKAFFNCRKIKEVVLPNSITRINEGTFMGCSILKKVVIPNSVTSIGEQAFKCCNRLETVNIPNSMESIEDDAFGDCNLDNVYIEDLEKTVVNEYAFDEEVEFDDFQPEKKTISETDSTEKITMTSITSIKNIPTSTSLSPPKTPTAKSKDSKKQSKEKTISQTDSTEKITMTSITSIKNIPTSTSLSPPKTPTAKSKDSKKQSKEKTISQTDSTEEITMTSFTSIKNISKTITLFLSTHTGDFAYDDLINKISNSSDVYGVEPETKLTKRQKMIKTVIQKTATDFVEMYKEMVESFPSEMSDELKLAVIKPLWNDFVKTDGLDDKLRTKSDKPTTTAVFNKSAYMYFCESKRPTLKANNPTMSPTDMTKSLGALWNLTKTSRKSEHEKFVKMALDNRVVDEEKEAEKEEKKIAIAERKAAREALKLAKQDAPKIKRGKTSFINFSDITRLESAEDEDFKSLSAGEKTKYIRDLWNDLSVTDKAPYKVAIPFVPDEPVNQKSQKENFFRMTRTTLIGYDDYDGQSESVKRGIIQEMWDDLDDEEKTEYDVFEPTTDSIRLEKELASESPALQSCSPDEWDYILNEPIVSVEVVVKSPNAIKRINFAKFRQEQLEDDVEFTSKSTEKQLKQLKKEWSKMSDEEKDEFA
jgi:hypothetical protein